jgi:hypothetical protein
MSFSITTNQVLAKEKTVTRRLGWAFLRPGDVLQAIEKGQGLKKGEHVKRLCLIRVVNVGREPLVKIKQWRNDCEREGFPNLSPQQFIEMFCKHNGCSSSTVITRIEFEYL